MRHSIDKRITIEHDYEPSLYTIDADSSQMNQMIMNLCLNAAEAMENGGNLSIKTENCYLDDDFCQWHDALQAGDYAMISVRDTGIGMDKAIQQQIFEPFFSTKPDSLVHASGLGLSTVYGIVKNHGGAIEVFSTLHEGSEFRLYFPKGKKEITIESEKPMSEISQGNACVLVVDDEELVREMVTEILSAFGYTVLQAENGQKGVEAYQEQHADIDLVILDMKMPMMDGREAFLAMQKINPNVCALLSTGYGSNNEAQEILDLGVKDLLSKPYKMEEILEKVQTALTSKEQ